ncbi:alanine--tRNA ligase [Endozoicomonas numazuensis]|uniref:Alanine--tRNA ligase n=1 Tax=Endozoicomonas numazuensis TaxID=1137799 RepID=A0A081NH50_9GAMM|nr:alanine--tRNA ligase [Endozoicomonas numazuensis]KEQ17773.1 alanyl-tRNA synthetase [Endozoicomonas numazuensis]
MKSSEIRSAFLEFFRENGHEIVSSSSLVPHDDPTLLFTNAGMNQFKDTFLGREQRAYNRATTSQKCVRAGGKHNDLENVGYTARHHTFFEMLGNFSFGDYFKPDAIRFAWTFLTEKLQLPTERLCVTVYETDDEAYNIWLNEVGVPAENIIRIGDNKGAPYASDNFWQMGDTGPCGPCTEIFYDHGDHIRGDRPGTPEEDGDRFIEIWNIVFMQYNRQAGGTMEPLPKPSVDTGMGLERIAAILQGGHSNYDIDIFQNLLKDAAKILGGVSIDEASLRVIADHIRSSSFLISDGIMPSNEGRGYTLRRIIRRACRHGHKLGSSQTFFYKLVASLVREMGDAYPDLAKHQAQIERILLQEEEQFTKTLDKGMKLLEDKLQGLSGSVIPGEVVFTLYDTYGFPVDLTSDIARERELTVDEEGFEKLLEAQRERARAASKFGVDYSEQLVVEGATDFTGYEKLQDGAEVTALFVEGQAVDTVAEGQQATIVLQSTPFYAESGGQVGDTGLLQFEGGQAKVLDTQKQGDNHLHIAELAQGNLRLGDSVSAYVDIEARKATELNHSATHLLHAALRNVLGEHVTQKGSLVDPDKLRFDFSHFEAVKPEELRTIERLVNQEIRDNSAVSTELLDMEAAQAKGAMALFGEKYGEEVRVLTMGSEGFSVELCGGTHVNRTGDIGSFRIISESGIAAGVRRIEAVTGLASVGYQEKLEDTLKCVASLVKGSQENVQSKVVSLLDRNKELERELQKLQQKLASAGSADLLSKVVEVNGIKVLATVLEGVDPKSLRDMVDQLKGKIQTGVVFLAMPGHAKFPLVAGVTKDLTGKVKAGDLLKMVAEQVGGRGGGRPDFAQGGGADAAKIEGAIQSITPWLQERL